MKGIWVLVVVMICMLMVSCKSLQVESNVKSIELGMTKQEVIAVMGNGYERVHAAVDESGNAVEVFDYPVASDGIEAVYKLYFLNGYLNRWDKEWITPPEQSQIIFPTVMPQ